MAIEQRSELTTPQHTRPPSAPAASTSRFRIDSQASRVAFTVRKMGFWPVHGRFRSIDGTIDLDPRGRPVAAQLSIESASVTTRMPPRDAHLRSSQFFDTTRHPQIRFEAHEIVPGADENLLIRGQLSVRGTSREITVEGSVHQHGDHLHVHAMTTVNRHDFDIRPPQPFEMIVGDTARLELELTAVRAP